MDSGVNFEKYWVALSPWYQTVSLKSSNTECRCMNMTAERRGMAYVNYLDNSVR